MNFTSISLLTFVAAASAFSPAQNSVHQSALEAHALGGWTPAAQAVQSAEGFNFGGWTPGTQPLELSTAKAAAPSAASAPAFSGFGHATGQMGANNSPFNQAVVATPTAKAASTAPVFSGFGHATGQMGGTNSLQTMTVAASPVASTPAASAAATIAVPAAPVFSGFGHATGQMGGNPSLSATLGQGVPDVPAVPAGPTFSGFGHAY